MQNQSMKVSKSLLMLCLFAFVALAVNTPDAFGKEAKALVDLNTASQQELEGLKGIGPAKARKIIEHRPYGSVDELSKAGIAAKTIDGLKPLVTAGPAGAPPRPSKAERRPAQSTTSTEKPAAKAATAKGPAGPVDLNTADQKSLESLPGIGPATAREIIKARPFKDADDLGRVKGMSKGKIEKLKGMVTVSHPGAAQPSAPPVPAAPARTYPAAQKPAKAESAAPIESATTTVVVREDERVRVTPHGWLDVRLDLRVPEQSLDLGRTSPGSLKPKKNYSGSDN